MSRTWLSFSFTPKDLGLQSSVLRSEGTPVCSFSPFCCVPRAIIVQLPWRRPSCCFYRLPTVSSEAQRIMNLTPEVDSNLSKEL